MEKLGVYWDRGDHSRIAGKQQVHNRLAFDQNGRARLYVFSTCKQFIRTVPCLVYDSCDVEDVDSSMEDHIYDELRYVCMLRPVSAMVQDSGGTSNLSMEQDPLRQSGAGQSSAYRIRTRFG
jgi:hypothetical protein